MEPKCTDRKISHSTSQQRLIIIKNVYSQTYIHPWLLQITGLLGLLVLCLWLSLRPKEPKFAIIQFSIPTSASSENPRATFSYVLEVKNSDKESSIYYDDILLSFKYKQDMAGNSTVPGFNQGKGNNDDQHVPPVEINRRVWRDLAKEIPQGTARLNVELFTSIKYKTWGIKSKHHKIKYQGAVPVGSDGKIKDKKKKVKLRRSKK